MNLEELLNAVNAGGHKWALFRRSKPSRKKTIAALVVWSQSLSKQLADCSQRERELYNENGDLRCAQAQLEERLGAAAKQITQYKGTESQLEQKLSKVETKAQELESEVISEKKQKFELELSKQQLENDIDKLQDDIKMNVETTNRIADSLEKCRHDCQNKETRYLSLASEMSRLEDKLRAAENDRSNVELTCRKLRDHIKTDESKTRQLEKDLATTRKVLNESYRDKHDTEKQLDAAIQSLRFQVFALGKSLHQKKLMVETLKKEKQLLMAYYQNQIYLMSQRKLPKQEVIPQYICLQMMDKSVQASLFPSTANTLKNKAANMPISENNEEISEDSYNKPEDHWSCSSLESIHPQHLMILDLEFSLYRREKLIEALCDIIQSHDPEFLLEEDEILKSFLDPVDTKAISHYELRSDLCLCTCDDQIDTSNFFTSFDDFPTTAESPSKEDCYETSSTALSIQTEDYSHELESNYTADAETSQSYESYKPMSTASSESYKSMSTPSNVSSDATVNFTTAESD